MLRYVDMVSADAPLLLGVQLRPLSLGAVMHMQEQNCLFISAQETPLLSGKTKKEYLEHFTNIVNELIVALTICSMTYEDFTALANDRLWVEAENKFITMDEYMKRWGEAVMELVKKDEVNLLQTIHLFNQYLIDGYKKPDVEYISDGVTISDPPTVDGITTLIETITSEKGISKSEVINQPLKLSHLQFYKIGEKNNCIHFVTDEERELREMAVKGAQT